MGACSPDVRKNPLTKCRRQFFFIFCFWAMLFCAWTFSTLVGLDAHASHNRANFSIDGQHVAIIVM